MAPMKEESPPEHPDHRFELRRMLQEIEAEARASAKPPGQVKQSDILEMIRNRKGRDGQGRD